MTHNLSWLQIVRLALVQTALGAMVVITTSTLNRIMVVELALPAIVPGALVGIHYALQTMRPLFGHGSDGGRRRTPFIVIGMAILALGATGAAAATGLIANDRIAGVLAGTVAFIAIGIGVGLAGTNLLTLVATHITEARRGPAATLIWMMMIAGFVVTTAVIGRLLDPYSAERLIVIVAGVCAIAFLVSVAAILGVEPAPSADDAAAPVPPKPAFREALATVWCEPQTRRFTVFICVSMLAYSGQDLILEPFAGLVFQMTPGETTLLSSVQNGGALAGMVAVAAAAPLLGRYVPRILRSLCIVGCLGSAMALAALAAAGIVPLGIPLRVPVFALGLFNGMFAVAAIGQMMGLAREGAPGREGMRMGIWGAAQAIAFGAGGFLGTVAVDLVGLGLGGKGSAAYASVFVVEALLFILSVRLAARAIVGRSSASGLGPSNTVAVGDIHHASEAIAA
ncbi:BCD family MFS transporter [Jiella sp. MQZ9-1]|uniref:BCD family MFS transporter n=1 Tax=Jiella flava TaxID=2816857 RepID=A0A939JWR5_9HYPH|nr:BCD family MFS transporter [Jiella flava]MBO0663307.1 BCD family MFS transporter [Jiella flava]MCD2471883.1 BCD family MFS transporter [Jiella flava]